MEKQFYCVHDWMTKELGLRGNERDVFAVIYSFSESCGEYTGGSAIPRRPHRSGTTERLRQPEKTAAEESDRKKRTDGKRGKAL